MWERALPVVGAMIMGYGFGAIPTGYLVGRARGIDVRQHGSGRIGGTNVYRALGWWAAALTGFGDVAKGALAVILVRTLFNDPLAAALAGAAAVIGHNWPVTLSFKGGAGGATAGAVLCALSPTVGIIVIPVALVMLFVVRYASLATLTAAIGAVIGLALRWLITDDPLGYTYVVGFALPTLIAVAIALRPNIMRLLKGQEKRIDFGRLKRQAKPEAASE